MNSWTSVPNKASESTLLMSDFIAVTARVGVPENVQCLFIYGGEMLEMSNDRTYNKGRWNSYIFIIKK